VTKRRLIGVVVLLAVVASATGCAAGRAYRRGQEAARAGDWDAAVAHYTRAVQENPDSPEYKIALERAMQSAALEHIGRARLLEDQDQLDAALLQYRRALELDPTNRLSAARAAELERTIRERIEASRPRPRIETLREQARQGPPPLIGLRERMPRLSFQNASVRDILSFIGSVAGISITYDTQFQDRAYSIELEDVTVEEALQQIMTNNQMFYKVVNQRTIIVVNDSPAKRAQYDELVVRVFYVSHVDATELSQLVNIIMRLPQMASPFVIFPNKTANTITVRATAQLADIIEQVIRANDKPRAEVVIDVQILEVNRARAKQYGLNLNAYAVGLMFSPEVAPPNTSTPPTGPPPSPPPFNVNTISQGVSTADFYATVPTALIRFLESDSHTKTIAKPQLRGAEGTKLTLNLGDDVPGAADGVRGSRAGRVRDDSAVVLHVPRRRREPRGDAARDLRRRDPAGSRHREQHARRLDRGRRAGGAHLRHPPDHRRGCGCARASPTCSPGSCGSATGATSADSRACSGCPCSGSSCRTTIRPSSRPTSSCS
jgi:general secretion pathway protein D